MSTVLFDYMTHDGEKKLPEWAISSIYQMARKKKRNTNTMKSRYKSGGASLVRNVREGSEGSAFP